MKRFTARLIALLCGLALMALCIFWQGIGAAESLEDVLKILSNAALLPGVLLTGIGGLAWISDEHFFDGIKYATGSIFAHLRGKPKRFASYYDYIHREKAKSGGTFTMLIPGLIFLGIAVLLTVLYYMVR